MLSSFLGLRLVLWAGPTVPIPPPPGTLDALQSVEVTNDGNGEDGFQITFALKKGLLDYEMLSAGTFDPFRRVWIGAVMGVVPELLIDGIVTHHQIAPSGEPGQSTLTVTGRSVSVMMDLEEKNAKFENQPDFLIATRIIAEYAQYGLIPDVRPTTDIPIMLDRIPRQAETDLGFLRRMAERNGFVFYIEPVTFGVNRAYFGPPSRIGLPQPALTMNMGHDTNLTSLRFNNDAMAPVGTRGSFVEPFTKMAIPIPALPSLRIPPLSSSPASARRTALVRDSANRSPAQAALAGLSRSESAPDPVEGTGEVDAVRYGSVLRARRLVGVRGAGVGYDGFYYVKRVTHRIEIGRYTQQFTLSREGTGASVPAVLP